MSDLKERLRKKVERFITMEATHTKTLEWEAADRIEQLEAALHRISLGSQDSGTTKKDLGREARAALEERT